LPGRHINDQQVNIYMRLCNHTQATAAAKAGHILTCAPTGAGKGRSGVIPNLLDYPGSPSCWTSRARITPLPPAPAAS
jgi:hypothetical protein